MGETLCVLLLLTGLCVLSASSPNLHFVKTEMTWDKAQDLCVSRFTAMAKIDDQETVNTMMSTPTDGYKDKAWIGLHENHSEWTWVDGHPATYSNWRLGQPDNFNASEFCVSLTDDGLWMDHNCSKKKPAVCFSDGGTADNKTGYYIVETLMTWTEAKTYCEEQGSVLATVPNKRANSLIKEMLDKESEETDDDDDDYDEYDDDDDDIEEAWIGLSRHNLWYWSDTGENSKFLKWQPGQPDNLSGGESCTAAVLLDGTWTDEDCNATFPFFCHGTVTNSLKTMVKMKIQSSIDMEETSHASLLLQQMHAEFVRKGVTNLTLSWRKPPVKKTKTERGGQFRLDTFLTCKSIFQEDEP